MERYRFRNHSCKCHVRVHWKVKPKNTFLCYCIFDALSHFTIVFPMSSTASKIRVHSYSTKSVYLTMIAYISQQIAPNGDVFEPLCNTTLLQFENLPRNKKTLISSHVLLARYCSNFVAINIDILLLFKNMWFCCSHIQDDPKTFPKSGGGKYVFKVG